MIAAALLALAVSTGQPATVPWCRGVAIETEEGRANFVWLIAEGADEYLRRFQTVAQAMRLFHVTGPRPGARGGMQVVVQFQTMRGRPQETTNPADALAFLERAQQGEFGQLTIRPMIMSMETLPADRS
jgi:hypothetical protein